MFLFCYVDWLKLWLLFGLGKNGFGLCCGEDCLVGFFC